jgi:hypothetical protein
MTQTPAASPVWRPARALTFSSPGLRPAAKGAKGGKGGKGDAGHVATSKIGDKGGQLQITDDGPGRHDKLVVTLDVPKKTLPKKKTTITMEISGGELSELVVLFSPAGLVFSKDASLSTVLEKDLYARSRGSVERVPPLSAAPPPRIPYIWIRNRVI